MAHRKRSPGAVRLEHGRFPNKRQVLRLGAVGLPIAKLAQEGFSGTVAELLARLNCMMSESMRRSLRWPKAPNALRRMASNLRAAGIQLQFSRADIRGRRVVSLVCASEPGKRSSVAVSGGQ